MGMGMVRRWRAVRALLVIVLGVEEAPAVLVVIRRSRQLGRDLAIASQGLLVCLLGRLDELALPGMYAAGPCPQPRPPCAPEPAAARRGASLPPGWAGEGRPTPSL